MGEFILMIILFLLILYGLFNISLVKVKAHTLREKSKSDLLKQLDELKLELSQVFRADIVTSYC